MKTVTVTDPVSRTEGQMKVKISIDTSRGQQQIVDADYINPFSPGTETVLQNSPVNVPILAEQNCAAYPISHIQAEVLALENIDNWLPSTNGRLLRNLTLGTTFLQAHILHFYLIAALDYITCPVASPWKSNWQVDIRPGLDNMATNLPAALGTRRRVHEMEKIFGRKRSGVDTCIPGGFNIIPTTEEIDNYRLHLTALSEFIESTYLPDVQLIGTVYSDYFTIGTGCRNFLAFGAFAMDDANTSHLFGSGYTENGSPLVQSSIIICDIEEKNRLAPIKSGGDFTIGPVNAPLRLNLSHLHRTPFEGGPLARMWINGDYQRTISVMDRHVARALEAAKVAAAMHEWLDEITPGESAYDSSFDQHSLSGCGTGLSETPCGPVGYSVKVIEGKISAYRKITPVCRQAAIAAEQNVASPLEQALIGTAIENPDHPIEALRVIHSYDSCLSHTPLQQTP